MEERAICNAMQTSFVRMIDRKIRTLGCRGNPFCAEQISKTAQPKKGRPKRMNALAGDQMPREESTFGKRQMVRRATISPSKNGY